MRHSEHMPSTSLQAQGILLCHGEKHLRQPAQQSEQLRSVEELTLVKSPLKRREWASVDRFLPYIPHMNGYENQVICNCSQFDKPI